MKQKTTLLWLLAIALFCGSKLFAQPVTTITTGLPNAASSLAATAAAITFTITNNNSYGIILTSLDFYRASNQNGQTFNLRYHTTNLSGQTSPTVSTWPIIATTVSGTVTTTAIHPLFTTLNFTIPANTTYRFAIQHGGGSLNYGGAATTPNSYTANGVTLGRGNYQINGQNVGYAGSSGSTLAFNPRFWCGTITFKPAIANDLSATSILTPANNSQLCFNTSMEVKTIIKNQGSAAQSNFPVGAYYTGPLIGNLSTVYAGTLPPGAQDTVTVGTITLQPGLYNLHGYTQLANDSLTTNDTSSAILVTVKPPVGTPTAFSDTVCQGDNAFLFVDAQPNTTYNWYSAPVAGTLVNVSNNLSFSPLAQDTTMYVSAVVSGCESGRVPITAAIGPPPSVNFGSDTSFCESLPLILDAGNPGGKYLWSTGDSTQTIMITNQSGTYWCVVDKYCLATDTVVVDIAPVPTVSGISYVRMNNTYYFTASSHQHVSDYVWIFGDGTQEAGTAPPPPMLIETTHTYALGINAPSAVKLVVNNNCGTDTAFRIVPTNVNDLESLDQMISLYPNPASNMLTIETEKIAIEEVTIISTLGSVVLRIQPGNVEKAKVDISSLPSANYIVRVRTAKGDINRPLQIVK